MKIDYALPRILQGSFSMEKAWQAQERIGKNHGGFSPTMTGHRYIISLDFPTILGYVATAVFDHFMSTTILQPSQKQIHSYGQSMSRDVNSIMRTMHMAWVQPENYCTITIQPEIIK